MSDPQRSGVGHFSRRKDLAALAVLFAFGALMNAFGMVSPIYAVESWLGRWLHLQSGAAVLGLIFAVCLIALPALLLGAAAIASRAWAGLSTSRLALAVRYTYALVPLGLGMWLAHYGFHFFTGLYTILPVTQSALGLTPHWTYVGLPKVVVEPLEFGFLLLGACGSLLVAWQLAEEDSEKHAVRAFAPWALVCMLLLAAAIWLMQQPMDMRTTIMAG